MAASALSLQTGVPVLSPEQEFLSRSPASAKIGLVHDRSGPRYGRTGGRAIIAICHFPFDLETPSSRPVIDLAHLLDRNNVSDDLTFKNPSAPPTASRNTDPGSNALKIPGKKHSSTSTGLYQPPGEFMQWIPNLPMVTTQRAVLIKTEQNKSKKLIYFS